MPRDDDSWDDDPDAPLSADVDDEDETFSLPDMACPECGRRVTEDTQKCPHCGDWITPVSPVSPGRGRWKGWLFVVAVALMLLAVLRWVL